MSTISISTLDILGEPVACGVLFIPQSTPAVDGPSVILSGSRSALTGSDGTASITLEAGSYSVCFQGIPQNYDALSIVVPDDDLEYPLIALISSGVAPLPQPLFNLMGFAVDADGDLVPDGGLIPGGQFELDNDGDLIPV